MSFTDSFVILPAPVVRYDTECKGGVLGTIASLAVSIAVPFVAPALAGAIFGSSIMGALGGLGGVLATAGTGAILGGLGQAALGNDWRQGALFGALGAGAVQGIGGFGSTASPLFGAALPGSTLTGAGGLLGTTAPISGAALGTSAAPVAAGAVPTSGVGLGASAVGGGLGAAAAPAAAPTGLAGLGSALPWDKLGNAAAMAAPQLLGAAVSELTPPSDAAQAAEDLAAQDLANQTTTYNAALSNARNINPEYFAQNAANAARIRTATAAAEGARTPGLYDPGFYAAENRRTAVDATRAGGTAYNDAYITALEAQRNANYNANALRPNVGAYSDYLSKYGIDAEREQRAEELSKFLTPFGQAFAKSTNTSQVT